jgi:hypothetical protein
VLLQYKGRLKEADEQFEKAVRIYEGSYGPRHPTVASLLNNIAGLMRSQVENTDQNKQHRRPHALSG